MNEFHSRPGECWWTYTLTTQFYRTNIADDTDFFSGAIYSDDGNALVFINKYRLKPFSELRDILIDGMFRAVPKLFYQLLTIHIEAYSHLSKLKLHVHLMEVFSFMLLFFRRFQWSPFWWFKKKQSLYQKFIDHVISVVDNNVGTRPNPELIMSDFELAILSSVTSRFPQSRVRGCFFHYSQVTT